LRRKNCSLKQEFFLPCFKYSSKNNGAVITGVSPINFGSYRRNARLCVGCKYTTDPGMDNESAKVIVTSPYKNIEVIVI